VWDCDDGTDCIQVTGMDVPDVGICADACDSDGEGCETTPYPAQEFCGLTNADETAFWCILICYDDAHCPEFQTCESLGSFEICYPDGSGDPDVDVDTDTDSDTDSDTDTDTDSDSDTDSDTDSDSDTDADADDDIEDDEDDSPPVAPVETSSCNAAPIAARTSSLLALVARLI
jgi:serine-aspartate repeat-containing protein C/D/E